MNYDLYFIPIIEKALAARHDKKQALLDAFRQIETLGSRDGFKTGYQQFCLFMAEIGFSMRQLSPAQLESQFNTHFARPDAFTVTLEKDGAQPHLCRFTAAGGSNTIRRLTPGTYRLVLDTGLCLWSGRLSESDLFDVNLKAAAAHEDFDRRPWRVISVMDGTIKLEIYTGPGSGKIKITLSTIRK